MRARGVFNFKNMLDKRNQTSQIHEFSWIWFSITLKPSLLSQDSESQYLSLSIFLDENSIEEFIIWRENEYSRLLWSGSWELLIIFHDEAIGLFLFIDRIAGREYVYKFNHRAINSTPNLVGERNYVIFFSRCLGC